MKQTPGLPTKSSQWLKRVRSTERKHDVYVSVQIRAVAVASAIAMLKKEPKADPGNGNEPQLAAKSSSNT
jgi:hypothetical protein